jgi:hypothetical protein
LVVTIEQQAAAVEREAVNLAGHVRRLEELVAAKRRPEHDLEMARVRWAGIAAAAKTMREIAWIKRKAKEAEI